MVEVDFPSEVLGEIDDATASALVKHMRGLGYKVDPPKPKEEAPIAKGKADEPSPPENTVIAESANKPHDFGTFTLNHEMFFDIITEIDDLASSLDMINPIQGIVDTAEAMAFPKDANGRCGLDRFAIWTQQLLGADLEKEMRKNENRNSGEVYRETMLMPEMIADVVRHRLQRMSVFFGLLQDHRTR